MPSYVLNYTIDNNDHFWIGCLNNGLIETDQEGTILNRYLSHATVNDVRIDHQNGLWVTTEGSGLFYCENTNEKYYRFAEPLLDNKVRLKELNKLLC